MGNNPTTPQAVRFVELFDSRAPWRLKRFGHFYVSSFDRIKAPAFGSFAYSRSYTVTISPPILVRKGWNAGFLLSRKRIFLWGSS